MTGNFDIAGFNIINAVLIEADNDLVLDCGQYKTLRLEEPVYDDFIPSVSVLATGGASPDVTNHTIQSVLGSYYSFDCAATEERLTVNVELYHGYKVDSDIEVHVHAMPSTHDSGEVAW